MSTAAWLLAIPQFFVAGIALYLAIQNHKMAIIIRESQPALSVRMSKMSAGAIFIVIAYVPATVGWLLSQEKDFIPSITTVACFVWDFFVFFSLYEWLKISMQEMIESGKKTACRPCPYREQHGENPYDVDR